MRGFPGECWDVCHGCRFRASTRKEREGQLEQALEGVGGKGGDGGKRSWPQLPAHLISPLLEAPLWDEIFHLKYQQRSGEAEVSLAGVGSCSASNAGWLHDLKQVTSSSSARAMRAPCDISGHQLEHLGSQDADALRGPYWVTHLSPKPYSAWPCAGLGRGKPSSCSPGVQNSELWQFLCPTGPSPQQVPCLIPALQIAQPQLLILPF